MTNATVPHVRRPRCRAGQGKAFNLIELLVVIGIITLLATLLMPTIQGIEVAKIKLQCRVNMANFAKACNMFAVQNETQSYPPGSVGDSESDEPDDYTVVNSQVYSDMGLLGLSDEAMTCQTIGVQDWMFSATEDQPMRMGVIYWLGRDEIIDPEDEDVTLYQSPLRRDRQYDPTSTTVVTCLAYDSQTSGTADETVVPGSVIPHQGTSSLQYPFDESPNPWEDTHPDGMAVGFRDGSAKFVNFEDLTPITQYHRIWYAAY